MPVDGAAATLFSHAYVLGGSPCSGKSTAAQALGTRFGIDVYKVDDFEQDHMSRAHPRRQPTMCNLSQMSWNEMWSRPVQIQVDEVLAFYRERFALIVEDLQQADPLAPILLEGAAFLPELLMEAGVNPQRVVFLVPTREFQIRHYAQRPWIGGILDACDDPEQAFANWMERDHLFGQIVARQAQQLGFRTIWVDGAQTVAEQIDHVACSIGIT